MTGGDETLRLWAGAGALVLAAALSAALILLLRPLLQRYALARPNARSSHSEPTPQGGGIAVIASTIIVTAAGIGTLIDPVTAPAIQIWTALAATALIAIVGGVDDLRPLPVIPRLLLQALAAAAAIATIPEAVRILPFGPWWAERLCLLVGLLWFINLVNFMDGIDWMTVAEVVPLATAIALLGVLGAIPPLSLLVTLALLGAVLGFAPFNRPVAKLFLGDVGSLPIGLLSGWLLLQVAARGHYAAALLLPLYYLADATLTLVRRIAAREQFWVAHRGHFYQRAGDRGFSVLAIVTRVFTANLALAALAFVTVIAPDARVVVASMIIGAALVAWLLITLARGKRKG